MYRVFQFFVLGLKVDIFIEFLVSCFYIIQFAVDAGLDRWDSMFQLVVTILILPALYFGRMTVRKLLPSFCFFLFTYQLNPGVIRSLPKIMVGYFCLLHFSLLSSHSSS